MKRKTAAKRVSRFRRPVRPRPAKKTAARKTVARETIALQQEIHNLRYQLQKYRFQLDVIRRASWKLTTELSLEKALESLASTAASFFSADAVTCMLWDATQQAMVVRASHGFRTPAVNSFTVPSDRLLAAVQGCDYLVCDDVRHSPFATKELAAQEEFAGVLSVILRYGGRVLGSINIFSRRPRVFAEEEIENAQIFAQQASVAVRNANLYGELREEAQIAKVLLQVAEDMGSLDTLDGVLNRVAVIVTKALEFRTCVLFLLDHDRELYLPAKAAGLPPHTAPQFQTLVLRQKDLEFSETEIKQHAVVNALDSAGRFPVERCAEVTGERDLLLVPLVAKGKLLGALAVAGYQGREPFDAKDKAFLHGIATQAAIAIDDAKLFEALEGAFWDIIKSLAAAIEIKDHYTHSHSESVIYWGSALAKRLKLEKDEIDLISKACLLHDLGKIGIEDNILRKDSPLTPAERLVIEKHPVIGAEILGSVRSLEEVARVVRHHHEHFDGSGYPDHLKGEDIPLMSRILQIADCYDAMTSDRPYRKALSVEQAMEQLRVHAGRQFDPKLVAVFLELLADEMKDKPQDDSADPLAN